VCWCCWPKIIKMCPCLSELQLRKVGAFFWHTVWSLCVSAADTFTTVGCIMNMTECVLDGARVMTVRYRLRGWWAVLDWSLVVQADGDPAAARPLALPCPCSAPFQSSTVSPTAHALYWLKTRMFGVLGLVRSYWIGTLQAPGDELHSTHDHSDTVFFIGTKLV